MCSQYIEFNRQAEIFQNDLLEGYYKSILFYLLHRRPEYAITEFTLHLHSLF